MTPSAQALADRHRHAVIVSRMVLTIVQLLQSEYRRKHVGAVMVEILVAMVIRINDGDGGKPLSISAISKKLGIPRTTVSHAIVALTRHQGGLVRKVGRAYTGNLDYLATRVDPPYWLGVVKAITDAADELRKR